jgi:hypothetical protein
LSGYRIYHNLGSESGQTLLSRVDDEHQLSSQGETGHGAFTDVDYGKPINFYKTIEAVDFLG